MSRTLPKPTVEELRSIAATYASSAEDRLGDSVNLKDADERDTSLALRREDLIIMCALEQWANALEGKRKVASPLHRPIYDRNGKEMGIGDRFTYLPGTKHEQVLEIFKDRDEVYLRGPHLAATSLNDFWHAATDEKISLLVEGGAK